MSETITLPTSPLEEGFPATREQDTAAVSTFNANIDELAATMPEHAALLEEARRQTEEGAENLRGEIVETIDKTTGQFHLRLIDSKGRIYSPKAPTSEVDEAAEEVRKERHLNPKGLVFKRVKKAASQIIADDREAKIDDAQREITALEESAEATVSEEDQNTFVDEGVETYWQQSVELLRELADIANTDVVTLKEKGVILGGVAIGHKMGPIDKYMTKDDKHRHFDQVLRGLIQTGLPRVIRNLNTSIGIDSTRRRFPQIDPESSFWQEKVRAISEELEASLASRDYMPDLRKTATRIVRNLQRKRRTNSRPTNHFNERSLYKPAVIQEVHGDIQRLQGEGLSRKAIYRRLARRYHPDTSQGAEKDDRFSYLSDWRAQETQESQTITG